MGHFVCVCVCARACVCVCVFDTQVFHFFSECKSIIPVCKWLFFANFFFLILSDLVLLRNTVSMAIVILDSGKLNQRNNTNYRIIIIFAFY